MESADERMLDGNAAAGELARIFSVDITSAEATCAGCGAAHAIGEAHLFTGAGYVLRCGQCGSVLMRVVDAPGRLFVELTGIRLLQIPTA